MYRTYFLVMGTNNTSSRDHFLGLCSHLYSLSIFFVARHRHITLIEPVNV